MTKEKRFDTKAQETARREYQKKSRDNARTPVQWSGAPNGGFTGPNVKPWMSVNPDYVRVNAEREVDDPASTYNYWASVLRLRKQNLDIFVYGDYVSVDRESEDVFAFVRDGEALVLCNFTDKALEWDPAANGVKSTREVLLSNYEGVGVATQRIMGAKWPLRPYEALVVLVNM